MTLFITIRQVMLMLVSGLETYGLAKGWIKERLYVTTRERGRHEGKETNYT